MKRYDLLVIGAGPAGLSAAIEGAAHGMTVGIFDENIRPGGQLFKQIHKFFGSKEHKAKVRGFRIGEELLAEAEKLGVDVHLNSIVMGIYEPMSITAAEDDHITSYSADNVVVATGASENTLPFAGWTLPGVIGAGAAQTMMNLHGIKPGNKILMVGSGNVGLVVGFQLLQAGCEIVAIIDAAPQIGGYGVHAAKVARTGVPFYLSHTIIKAEGEDRVTGVTIGEVDNDWNIIPDTERHFAVDTICMAVGLSPMSQLVRMTGCKTTDQDSLVPEYDKYGATSIDGLYVAGDVGGIEEASSAMLTGRIAALAAAKRSGFVNAENFDEQYCALSSSLAKLRTGMFSRENKSCTDLWQTQEGYSLSQSLLKKGFITEMEIAAFPGADRTKRAGIHPAIECTQNIPCNPCQDACKFGCISVGSEITALPAVNQDKQCTNCGMCVASCPGQAIFLVNETFAPGLATVTMPYELLPLPAAGDAGWGLDRSGKPVCDVSVLEVKTNKSFDHTALVTIKVPQEMAGTVRFYRRKGGCCQ